LSTCKELFPDWTELDLLVVIEESSGDLEATIGKISEGKLIAPGINCQAMWFGLWKW
jgi:hypothetical protein